MGKAIILASVVALLAALGGFAAWFHAGKPPGCTDPGTLALVRQSFARNHLPPSTRMTDIRTVAGGFLALRFVCRALLTGIDKKDLPPDTPIPGEITYISTLTDHGTRHHVTVQIQPLLIWEKVQ